MAMLNGLLMAVAMVQTAVAIRLVIAGLTGDGSFYNDPLVYAVTIVGRMAFQLLASVSRALVVLIYSVSVVNFVFRDIVPFVQHCRKRLCE
jgi:hypothetical protein